MSKIERLAARARKIPGLEKILVDILEAAVREAEHADRDYERKHWGELPSGAEWAKVPSVRPGDVITALGTLEEVAYRTTKKGEDAIYVHPFERQKPILAYTRSGRLLVVGGSYRVTTAGIVG